MRAVRATVLLSLVGWCLGRDAPLSPCPAVFRYEPMEGEQGRWYGTITLPPDRIQYPLRLNIVLDSKVQFLTSWSGDVTSNNIKELKIKHIKMGTYATNIHFYSKHYSDVTFPKITSIKLNGVEICNKTMSSLMKTVKTTTRWKRDDSWLGYIGHLERTPPTPLPSTPPQQDWFCYISGSEPMPPCMDLGSRVNTEPEVVNKPDQDDWLGYITRPGLPAPPPPVMTPPKPDPVVDQVECGKVSPKPLLFKGNATYPAQWPWQIALYHSEHVDNKFKCGGTLVSRRHVVTAAHCVTHKRSRDLVNTATISVYLGRHNLRTSTDNVQIRYVSDVAIHPQYNGTSLARDLSIVTLMEPVEYTDYVRPICLWPDDRVALSHIIGKKGTVVGWGVNEKGVETEELRQIEIPVVGTDVCLRSNINAYEGITSNTTFCAGLGAGSTACTGDSGGGMVMNIDGAWYLRGLVSLSIEDVINGCDPSNYVVFTDLAKFLPWIKQIIHSTN